MAEINVERKGGPGAEPPRRGFNWLWLLPLLLIPLFFMRGCNRDGNETARTTADTTFVVPGDTGLARP